MFGKDFGCWKALLKSSASASVQFPRLKFVKLSCRTLATHSVVLWPVLNPNCSLGMFCSIPNIFNLVKSTRSASLLTELSKEGSIAQNTVNYSGSIGGWIFRVFAWFEDRNNNRFFPLLREVLQLHYCVHNVCKLDDRFQREVLY